MGHGLSWRKGRKRGVYAKRVSAQDVKSRAEQLSTWGALAISPSFAFEGDFLRVDKDAMESYTIPASEFSASYELLPE